LNYREYTRINRKLEARYFPRVLKELNEVKDRVISLVEVSPSHAVNVLSGSLTINGIAPVIKDLYIVTGIIHARFNYRELRQTKVQIKAPVGLGFSQEWTNNINAILERFLTDKILFKTSQTTKELLLSVITKGIEQGKGISEIVKDLEQTTVLINQAERIVRTEINRAANIGITEAGKSFPFEQFKEWISIKDLRTRGLDKDDHADHFRMHGQRVDFDSPFIDPRNNEPLTQPGDPSAHPGDTVNCRCTMRLIAKRDERGRLIPKRRSPGITIIQNFNRPQMTITV
jgi:hypothetical protein